MFGEPVGLKGRSIYFTSWKYVRPGGFAWSLQGPSGQETGFCRARVHRARRIVPLTYGRVAALHWTEVERKPLFHFYPGRIAAWCPRGRREGARS